jgi:hypothetical protein
MKILNRRVDKKTEFQVEKIRIEFLEEGFTWARLVLRVNYKVGYLNRRVPELREDNQQ